MVKGANSRDHNDDDSDDRNDSDNRSIHVPVHN